MNDKTADMKKVLQVLDEEDKIHFFSSFETIEEQPHWENSVELKGNGTRLSSGVYSNQNLEIGMMKTEVDSGPRNSYTGKTNVGWSGQKALSYSGHHVSSNRAYSFHKIFEVDIDVTPATSFSYLIHPEFADEEERDYSSTYVSLDLAFSDGTYLSELEAVDQHGVRLTPIAQGDSKTLYPNQWNYKTSKIGLVASGKKILRILVAYDQPKGPGIFKGSIDDIRIAEKTGEKVSKSPIDYVSILRGTNSNSTFSRGNNFPAVALPHGFNFWTPVTDAGSTSWLYSYQQHNNRDNLPELQAFSLSHQTSPWMGDRQTFQVMPSGAGNPCVNRKQRALPFQHKNEVAKPHYYKVLFENGIKTEFTPTNRAAMFRFTFVNDVSSLIFDNVNDLGGLTILPEENIITGYSDVKSNLSVGATRMFIYATFDKKMIKSGKLTGENRDHVAGFISFNTEGSDKSVTMTIATSLISVEQAKRNLHQEIKQEDTFESLKNKAKHAWEEKLNIIEVEGASEVELTTLYSNLYRLFLYPNISYENTGTKNEPKFMYASPFSKPKGKDTPVKTGAYLVEGKPYINNGFWDTYRTAWPAYVLFSPTHAGEMIDGFIQQYKDGGWISRWSSPGYANLMVGTSSDVAFADAYLKGVTNFDVNAFYESAIKNAAVASEDESVGRKGLTTSIFDRFTNNSVEEGLSWAMDGFINDFAIANLASVLALQTDPKDPMYSQYCTDAIYYKERAQNFVEMFHPDVKFFMGKKPSGDWRTTPDSFHSEEWGGDYTETNAWNMAFHVPHDGQGLANLYGGRKELAQKLDALFSIPETGLYKGHYSQIIHEMREARDVRMGMYAHSNQPSHHILYMYHYVGQPAKAQEKIREVLSRLYIGSEIGQGYPGDEDNGEMSAWYLFSAAGFYPLQMGAPSYTIGAPYFKKMIIHLENGHKITILAPNVSNENKYIQSLKVNGIPYHKVTIDHETLTNGATLEFEMGNCPSDWGTGIHDLPASLTPISTNGTSISSTHLNDLTDGMKGKTYHSDHGPALNAFDNNSLTQLKINHNKAWIQYEFEDGKKEALLYTLTSGLEENQDPKSWVLLGSNDGEDWEVLDRKEQVHFKWRRYTKAFTIKNPGAFSHYRFELLDNGGSNITSLSQIELLGFDHLVENSKYVKSLAEKIKNSEIQNQVKYHLSRSYEYLHQNKVDLSVIELEACIIVINQLNAGKDSGEKEQLIANIHALMFALKKVIHIKNTCSVGRR